MKDIYTYKVSSFVDYAGIERKFIICAISTYPENNEILYSDLTYEGTELVLTEPSFARKVMIGYAICNPKDQFDEEVGKKIAFSRAKSKKAKTFYATSRGFVNDDLVKCLIESEEKHIQKFPGDYIVSYEDEAEKFKLRMEAIAKYEQLSDEEKILVDAIRRGKDIPYYHWIADSIDL